MSLRIVLHPAAIREVHEARAYYAEVQESLGDAFEDELSAVLERAARLPMSGRAWSKKNASRRVFGLRRFPYLVIARVTATDLRVAAVAHERRRPGYWRGRKE